MGLFTRHSTLWKPFRPWARASGVWKQVKSYFAKDGSVWKSVYTGSGQLSFTSAGSQTWVVPDGVTSICAVTIGGGGGARNGTTRGGGQGGGLAYKNDIPVTPGETLTIEVGDGGQSKVNAFGGNGGDSYVSRASTMLCHAAGGQGGRSADTANSSLYGKPLVGDNLTVGKGGTGGGDSGESGGGGGAGGYTGNGGNGASTASTGGNAGYNGTGGGGGGGGSGGGGGGTGVSGEGASGTGGALQTSGTGGSGGTAGSSWNPNYAASGGPFGGGAGSHNQTSAIRHGGQGAVRIIWGEGRAYPSTNTGDV